MKQKIFNTIWTGFFLMIIFFTFTSRTQGAETYTVDQVIECLILCEDSTAKEYGDNWRALGELQIHPIMVRECNRLLGREEFTLEDRTNPKRCKMMARVFIIEQMRRYRLTKGILPPIVLLIGSWQSGSISKSARQWYYKKAKVAWYKVKNGEA